MSHFRRSNFGRFQSNTATESYQRQLTTPVNKWKRQWVSPTGLAPESSYKICKWVKIKEKAKLAGAVSDAGDGDDVTPAPDGDEADEGEGDGEDMDEDDQSDEGDENEGDDDDGDGDEGKATEDQTPAPAPATAVAPATSAHPPDVPPFSSTPAAGLKTGSSETPAVASEDPSTSVVTTEGETSALPTTAIDAGQTGGVVPEEESHEAPVPPHHEIPSNAIEVSNVAPQSTESGLATVGTKEEGVEMEMRPAEEDVHHQPVQEDEKMDVDDASAMQEQTVPPAPVPEAAAGVPNTGVQEAIVESGQVGTPLEKDDGLIMGEMELPSDKAELKVDGEDHPPAEVEK
ncbi:hypothetical protein I317_03738 [Kwoniella heveanensis CBS 569]|nr:hypothetical protein I317_03738 [Kwoniella heveanensis CBS 569]